MPKYDPKQIEPKWQQVWDETQIYQAKNNDPRQKYYYLAEFPYASGEGLHTGHAREYTAVDVLARHKRMQGFNVLYPMGYDAFGLPTENYAIKHKIAPQVATARNIAVIRQQLHALGLSVDWSREVTTSDPDYYRWTQWIFLRFFKAGLAYQAEIAINWCPFEKTGLANEEVVGGRHERCGTVVEKKLLKQWLLKITAYADRLIEGLKQVDYPEQIAAQQINWIGRSEGAEIDFAVGSDATATTAETFKFRPWLRDEILANRKTVAFRLEPKDVKPGDRIRLVNWETKQPFALAEITRLEQHQLKEIPLDFNGHEPDAKTPQERRRIYSAYYQREVTDEDMVYIYHFKLLAPIVTVFTTRPDTLGGATFLVLAPEHPAVAKL